MIILTIGGEDYAAMHVEQGIGINEAYRMTKEAGGKLTIDNDETYADLKIYEFGEVDETFVSFVQDAYIDYDHAKSENFYVIYEGGE